MCFEKASMVVMKAVQGRVFLRICARACVYRECRSLESLQQSTCQRRGTVLRNLAQGPPW